MSDGRWAMGNGQQATADKDFLRETQYLTLCKSVLKSNPDCLIYLPSYSLIPK
jgi:hypothetical protein